MKTKIYVYAHWLGMKEPKRIGILNYSNSKGRTSYSFEYDKLWINSKEQILLDPDIGWYSGNQFPNNKENFGVFLDSMPDTWGRTLIKKRNAYLSDSKDRKTILDIDYLLGVYDEGRSGALRFKTDENGPFLDNSTELITPPWEHINSLQQASFAIENDITENEEKKWINILIAPGSSLGGARPKANILDKQKHPWIAKFPSKNDIINKGAWEYLAYLLAIESGIKMSDSKIIKVSGNHHTFITKRFDRYKGDRIHFASAMTMTSNNEFLLRDKMASYLDIAEFIQYYGGQIKEDLDQLWRRIIFNIAISNTDDHLRNHGFIIENKSWRLSPAYDINPSIDKNELALNIDENHNELDFEIAKSVGVHFDLSISRMEKIIKDVSCVCKNWRIIANKIGISKTEQKLMETAFVTAP